MRDNEKKVSYWLAYIAEEESKVKKGKKRQTQKRKNGKKEYGVEAPPSNKTSGEGNPID